MRHLLCVAAAALLLACPVTSGPSCEARCITAGYCCTGNSSGCQHPSCQMGCVFGAGSPTVASCNATCLAAKGCSFTFQGQTFQMCGDCSQRWLDPTTLTPVVLPGAQPFWPPGWDLGSCGSCDTEQCQVGCVLAFDPGLNPSPPASPTPLPPKPYPPPPFPNAGPGFNISAVFGSSMVLQRAPAAAAIFGVTGSSGSSGAVKVTVTPGAGGGAPYTVAATVSSGRWKALLHPAADDGVDYTIAAACDAGSGCSGSMQLTGVRFGDVYYCAGQSNMWLQMRYTYALNASRAAIAAGQLDNIRLMSGDSQTQGLAGGAPPLHPWRTLADAASLPPEDPDSWAQFSATCFHFAEALTERFKAAGQAPPTLGLVATAIGGSTIEEWMTNAEAEKCFGFQGSANGAQLNHVLWDANVAPFLDMTVKGWLFYQGENNAGSLHGNSAQRAGYACLMPALIAAWRAAWSAVPGTTDPLAPFFLATLSTGDSEGAGDIASFRWAQGASYGVAPNPAMPNTYWAHGYDLADPWVNCGDHPQTALCPGCDSVSAEYSCLQQWYMGPGIHPRLKKPFGQRLAASAMAGVYGAGGPVTGPTLAGCAVSGSTLTLAFNATLLAGSALAVAPYNASTPANSGLSVLVNATEGQPGSGKWVALNVRSSSSSSLVVDLAPLQGAAPSAVKYAWGKTGGPPDSAGDVWCCPAGTAPGLCTPGACPIHAATEAAPFGGHPANPFLALIQGGQCLCPLPQVCSAAVSE